MTPAFAYDPAADGAGSDLLNWMQAQPQAPYWALVDVELLGAAPFKAAARRHHWAPVNALANTPLQAFGEVAPHLIALGDTPQERQAQIAQLLTLAAGTPALSFLRSAYPAQALQLLFGYLAKAQVQGRARAVHLRFADSRILPGLLQTLAPSQQRRVADIVQDWRGCDRYGHVQGWLALHEAVPAAQMDTAPHLHLCPEQLAALLTQAEADAVFYQLTQQHPELLPQQQRAAFHQRLATCLSTASEMNLSTEQDRWLFVLLSLNYGNEFYRCPALAPTWDVIGEQGVSLQEQTQEWSTETLQALMDFKASPTVPDGPNPL